MKNISKITLISILFLSIVAGVSAATLGGWQGGTGYATSTAALDGKCLMQSSSSPYLTWAIGSCGFSTSSPITINQFPYWSSATGILSGTSSLSLNGAIINASGTFNAQLLTAGTSTVSRLIISTFDPNVPLIYADTDSNTGIMFEGPDVLHLHSGGGAVISLNAAGWIGLNTEKPSTTVHIVGTSTFANSIFAAGSLNVSGTITQQGGLLTPLAMTTIGDMQYWDGTSTHRLAGNSSTQQKFLSQFSNQEPTWQTVPAPGSISFYMNNESSTGINYKLMAGATSTLLNITIVISAATTSFGGWITASSSPNITNIPGGLWGVHLDATESATTKITRFYVDVYKRNSVGVETLLFTTPLSDSVTETDVNNPQELDFEVFVGAQILSSTDRLVMKVVASLSGAGANPSVGLYYGGATASRLSLPGNTVDATNFVPYSGATANVDLGLFGLTAPRVTSSITTAQGDSYLTSTAISTQGASIQVSSSMIFATSGPMLSISGSGKTITFTMNTSSLNLATLVNPASTTITAQGASASENFTFATSGPMLSISASGNTVTFTMSSSSLNLQTLVNPASTTITAQGGVASQNFTFATSGPMLSIAGSGNTVTFTMSSSSLNLGNFTSTTNIPSVVHATATITAQGVAATQQFTFASSGPMLSISASGNTVTFTMSSSSLNLQSFMVSSSFNSHASTSINFIFYDATTTSPYRYQKVYIPYGMTLTGVACDNTLQLATTTFEIYRITSIGTTTNAQTYVPTVSCGALGNTITTFTSATVTTGTWMMVNVTSTTGTPTFTTLTIYGKKTD